MSVWVLKSNLFEWQISAALCILISWFYCIAIVFILFSQPQMVIEAWRVLYQNECMLNMAFTVHNKFFNVFSNGDWSMTSLVPKWMHVEYGIYITSTLTLPTKFIIYFLLSSIHPLSISSNPHPNTKSLRNSNPAAKSTQKPLIPFPILALKLTNNLNLSPKSKLFLPLETTKKYEKISDLGVGQYIHEYFILGCGWTCILGFVGGLNGGEVFGGLEIDIWLMVF